MEKEDKDYNEIYVTTSSYNAFALIFLIWEDLTSILAFQIRQIRQI